ncbi:MAG: hypothetical protein JWP74_73, partial [Marmoricola sp.]|nr:hypothetical protein [Marmoricola sp.]
MSADTTTKVAPGELAETPAEVPARGWWQIV